MLLSIYAQEKIVPFSSLDFFIHKQAKSLTKKSSSVLKKQLFNQKLALNMSSKI